MKNNILTNNSIQNECLDRARGLNTPPREAVLQRLPSVEAFWKTNRQVLSDAWTEWEHNAPDLLVPDETLLDSRLRDAISNAWNDPSKESAVKDLWQEIMPDVYQAQFFDPKRLSDFREYLEATANAGIPTRPPYGIALNRHGAMLDQRSEGYLAAPNFQAFYQNVMDQYMRPIARLLLDTYGYDNQTFGFSIQYDPDLDTSLQPHTDASSATMNINLNKPNENFTGSEVDFYDYNSGKKIKTTFASGMAIIHRGSVPHATHPITSGKRTNMVLWLYGDNSYVTIEPVSNSIIDDDITPEKRWSVPNAVPDGYAPF